MNSHDTPAVPPAAGPHDRPGSRPTKGPTRVGAAPETADGSPRTDGVDLPMPHERDEAAGHTAVQPNPVIDQARKDLEAGQVDTDMRVTPGLDAQRRADLTGTPEAPHGGGASDSAVGRSRQDLDPRPDRRGATARPR